MLLLDEPLSALDAKVRAQLRDQIRRIQLEVGITTLFVTHDQEEALAIADRVGVMKEGRIEQLGPPTEIYSRPATSFVAEFVGLSNRLAGTVSGSTVTVRGRDLPLVDLSTPPGPATALVRPEAVTLASSSAGRVRAADRNRDRGDLPGRDQPGHGRPGRHHDPGPAPDLGRDGTPGGEPRYAGHPPGPRARVRGRTRRERGVSGGQPPLTTQRRLGPGAMLRQGSTAPHRAAAIVHGEPLGMGTQAPRDFTPAYDASRRYIRNHTHLADLEEMARFPPVRGQLDSS